MAVRNLQDIPGYPRLATDRDVHDEVIRYLTDARLRTQGHRSAPIDDEDAERAERFARFLARRYYRDRLHRGFRYSRLLAPALPASQTVDQPGFDSVLESCVLGSLATAIAVADFAVRALQGARDEQWWKELLDYERAFFLQLATSEATEPLSVPRRQISSMMLSFTVPTAELLRRIKEAEDLRAVPAGTTTLLFSRTEHGKIYVAEIDDITARVFRAIDGLKSQNDIAAACQVSEHEIRRILRSLGEIGSVVLP